jgi:hypothetical protein
MAPTRDEAKTPPLEELRALIQQEQKDDPLVGAKVGSKLALEMLLDQLKTEQGVHAETLMALAGVLVGRSVQASLWAEAHQGGHSRVPGLQLVRCHDDSQVLVGDPINRRLMEGYGSPWQVLSEAARQEGCASLPAGEQLLLEGIQRIGTAAFGHPGVPPSHTPQVLEPDQQTMLAVVPALVRSLLPGSSGLVPAVRLAGRTGSALGQTRPRAGSGPAARDGFRH